KCIALGEFVPALHVRDAGLDMVDHHLGASVELLIVEATCALDLLGAVQRIHDLACAPRPNEARDATYNTLPSVIFCSHDGEPRHQEARQHHEHNSTANQAHGSGDQ